MRSYLPLVLLISAASCGPSAPSEPVVNPRAYVHDQLVATATPSWADGRSDYNLDEPAFLDSLIDARVERDAGLGGELPSDQRGLDRFVGRLGPYYSTAAIASAERRAAIEALVRDRFDHPPATFDSETRIARADLGIATARFQPDRTSFRLQTIDSVSDGVQLVPDEVARAFGRLHAEHPDARVLELTVRMLTVSGGRDATYTYHEESDVLVLEDGLELRYESPQPIGGIDRLIGGQAATQAAELARLCEDIDAMTTYRC